MNIISLITWGNSADEGNYYKIYGYIYDKNGNIQKNEILNEDLIYQDITQRKIRLNIRMQTL